MDGQLTDGPSLIRVVTGCAAHGSIEDTVNEGPSALFKTSTLGMAGRWVSTALGI